MASDGSLLTERLRRPGGVDNLENFLDYCEKLHVLNRQIGPTDILKDSKLVGEILEVSEEYALGYTREDILSWARNVQAQGLAAEKLLHPDSGGSIPFFG